MKFGFLKFKQKKEQKNQGKLTPEQREEIAQLHADGMSTYKIAKKFGVRQSTAHYWANQEYREKKIARMREKTKTDIV